MSEDVKKSQTEGKIAETSAENPQAEEEFEVSEEELEDAAGGRGGVKARKAGKARAADRIL